MRLSFSVNGESREIDGVWEGESLLYVLRERMGLPGRRTRANRASADRAPSMWIGRLCVHASCWRRRHRAATS